MWFFEHAESILVILGALLTFTTWNITQGVRLRAAEKDIEALKTSQATLREQQDAMVKPLYDELRRIGEKLAHIEGFLTAKKQSEGP